MGKYEKKKTKKFPKGLLVALALVVMAAVLAVLVLPREPGSSGTEPENSETEGTVPTTETQMTEFIDDTVPHHETDPETETGNAGVTVAFPHQLEDGALEIESLFQFEGINPDCGNREGDRIATILVRNTSGLYLKSAAIWAELNDGTEILFSVSDLPAGKGALAFSVDNTVLTDDQECTAFRVDSVFEEAQAPEGLSVLVNGTDITVTNETNGEIIQIEIICHGVFGDLYYGGVSYLYTIDNLPAGECATITAADCMIGVAEVVWITGSDEK